jgi:drug/metabolite transporter (DMT)-like permease
MPAADPLHSKAVRILLFCTALWGVSFPTMKALEAVQETLLPDANSWFITALGILYRFGIAGLILVVIFWRDLKTLSRRELEQGLILAGFGAGGMAFQMDGLAYTAASTSAFLTQGYCVFIPLWIAVTHGRHPSVKTLASIALVVTGVAVLARISLHSLTLKRGELETLIASLMFTGQILSLEHPRYRENRSGNFSTVMFLGMTLLCVPLVMATAPSAAACLHAYASLPACGFLAVLIVFCTLIAYTMMNYWQRHITATEAGLIYCLEPAFASLFALFLPALFSRWSGIHYANEQFTLRLLIGGGLVTAANILVQSPWLEKKASPVMSDQ